MKKIIVNSSLSILFSITLIVTIFCLTSLNKNFVLRSMERENYYQRVYEDIKVDFDKRDLQYKLTEKEVRKDIQSYVRSRYKNEYFHFDEKDLRDDYNKYIKFYNYFGDFDVCSMIYLLYFIDLILIVVTGMLFLKTKEYHNLSVIMISNFITTFILFGIIALWVKCDNAIIDLVVNKFNHYYLATSIILLEIVLYNKIKPRLKG